MNKLYKKLILILVLFLCFPYKVIALEQENSITVKAHYTNEQSENIFIAGDDLKLVKIADFNGMTYEVIDSFKSQIILQNSMTSSDYNSLAKRLVNYIDKNGISYDQVSTTNQEGIVEFEGLDDGMYLIYEYNNQLDYYMDPFIISIPLLSDNYQTHSIICEPKFKKKEDSSIIELDEPVEITPMDMTIYTGGKGYSGVIGSNGSFSSNDLPEIGFYVTLPAQVNELLGSSSDNPIDLSSKLTIIYNDDNGETRSWSLTPYGTQEHSTSSRHGHTVPIYKIKASKINESNQTVPVRMQFTSSNGTVMVDSKFPVNINDQYRNYQMNFFTGDLDDQYYDVEVNVDDKTVICPLKLESGILKVRGNIDQYYADIGDDLPKRTWLNRNQILAQTGQSNTIYFINQANVQVKNTDGVRLLVDKTLDDPILLKYIEENHNPDHKYCYKFAYMDIVDTQNGDDYLTMGQGQSLKVYWPVPSDAKKDSKFHIIHFEGLDRETNTDINDMLANHVPKELPCEVVYLQGKKYVEFSTESFSPFALLYEKDTNKVDTGDYLNYGLWMGLFVISLICIICFHHKKKD